MSVRCFTANPTERSFVIFLIDCRQHYLIGLKGRTNYTLHENLWKFIVWGNYCPLNWDRLFLKHELKVNNELNIADCRNKCPKYLPSLRGIASNHNAYGSLYKIDFKSAYNVENLTMLCGAVCRQTPEMLPNCGYIKLCVDKDWTVADGYMELCGHRTELWPRVGYMKMCVDRDFNCGWRLHAVVCRQRT
jgi:hypothetical protein